MVELRPLPIEVALPNGAKKIVRSFTQGQLVRVLRDASTSELDRQTAEMILKHRADTGEIRARLK